MLKNYLKIAFRNLAKYKVISFINLFGLTVGLTCCLLILTYILHEESYDKYNSKADRVWRVTRSFNNKDGIVSLHLGAVAPPFGPLLQNDFPDIEKITRLLPAGSQPVRYEDKLFNEDNIFFADNNLFSIFDVTILKGDRTNALTDPLSVVMTETVAKRYFGDADPINKVIRINNLYNLRVSGIIAPFPETAHFHPEILFSFNALKDSAIYGERNLATNWGNNAFFTYLLLPPNYPAKSLEARFPAFLDRHMPSNKKDPASQPSRYTKLFLQNLTDIHLHGHTDEEIETNGDSSRITIFAAIALFILLIACINYMNLSTARSTLRAKEIGIRKVSGAQRYEIIYQFLSESVLISWLAIILAATLTTLALPWLNGLTGLHLSIQVLLRWYILVPLILTPFVIGILSGIYPALFMSSFQPVKVLKGLFKAGSNTVNFRKVLVVMQFAISIVLLISTAIVFQQLHYMQNASLGFDKDHVLTLRYNNGLDKTFESFRTALGQDPHVLAASRSSRIPSGRLLDEMGAQSESGDSLRPVNADIKYVAVDHDFVKTYGIPIVAGRDFSRNYATDSTGYLLNVAATKVLGLKTPQEMIGRNFAYGGVKGKVIGVMGDFNFEDMHQSILPIIFVILPASQNQFGRISIKLAGANLNTTMTHIEKTWKRYLPEVPFE